MNLHIKTSYFEPLSKNNIYPPWTIAFQPPPTLMLNQCQIETILTLRKTQAKEMLTTLSMISTHEPNECKTELMPLQSPESLLLMTWSIKILILMRLWMPL